jgi:hypothetical protein
MSTRHIQGIAAMVVFTADFGAEESIASNEQI